MCYAKPAIMTRPIARIAIALALLCALPAMTWAQSGTPRNYGLTPVDATTAFINLTGSGSETAADANLSLPSNLSINRSGTATILYSFPLGAVYGGVAITAGSATVTTRSGAGEAQTTGFTDPSMTFHVNLFGGPALRRDQYASFIPVTYATFHLTVNAPLGTYDRYASVNSGAHRWTISPLVNYSITTDRGVSWIDLYAGAQFYSANEEYRGDGRLTQAPLVTLTAYYSHNITSTAWAGIGVYYRNGGETSVNGVSRADSLNSIRPSVAISEKWGGFRFTLRFDSPTSDPMTRSGVVALQISSPPF
jgi:hypothetical protein